MARAVICCPFSFGQHTADIQINQKEFLSNTQLLFRTFKLKDNLAKVKHRSDSDDNSDAVLCCFQSAFQFCERREEVSVTLVEVFHNS